MKQLTFKKLIDSIGSERFISECWEKQCIHIPAGRLDALSGLFNLSQLDSFLARDDIQYPFVKLINKGSEISKDRYTRDVRFDRIPMNSLVDGDKLLSEIKSGATLQILSMQRIFKSLRKFVESADSFFSFPTSVNGYLTPPNSFGLPPHYDTHCVFVLQITGSKVWNIFESKENLLPGRHQYFSNFNQETSPLILNTELKPGDVLYIPRGFIHQPFTNESYSLHLTLAVHAVTWLDLLRKSMGVLESEVDFRSSLPIYSTNDQLKREFSEKVDRMYELLIGKTNLSDLNKKNYSPTQLRGIDGGLINLINSASLKDDTMITLKNEIFDVHEGDNSLSLSMGNKVMDIPVAFQSIVKRLISQRSICFSEMLQEVERNDLSYLIEELNLFGLIRIGNRRALA